MDFRFLYHRIRYIILNPAKAWEYIHQENRPIRDVRNSFLLPVIILVTICAFLGSLIFINPTLSPVYSLFIALKVLLLNIIVIYLSTIVLSEITKALDLGKNFLTSYKLIVYSLTPYLICQIISQLFDSLIFINILSIYGLYIFSSGADMMLKPQEHKRMPMLIAIAVVVTGFYIAFGLILSSVIDRIYFSLIA
jgi:hypothetical protein